MNKKIPILCALLLALLPLAAWAGKVEFRDEAAILTLAARQEIAARFSAFPFSVRVLTSTSSPSRPALESRAASFLTSPDMIVVSIDPAHRFTAVRVGSGLNVEPGTFSQIAVAGNPSFKSSQWGAGIIAIGETANGKLAISNYLRNTAPQPSFPATQVIVHQPAQSSVQSEAGSGSVGWLLAGMIATLIVICAVGIILARRRHAAKERQEKQDRLDAEAERILSADLARASLRADQVLAPARQPSSPVNPMPSHYDSAPRLASYAPSVPAQTTPPIVQRYQPPAPVVVSSPPVVVHHDHGSSTDGLLTGMLLSEAIHDHGHRHRHDDDSDRHVVRERVVEVERPSSSYDSGGASSGWGGSSDSSSSFSTPASDSGSSSSSSSSYDGGGSSSSWDSGSSSSSSFDSSSSDSSSSSSFDSGGGSSDF